MTDTIATLGVTLRGDAKAFDAVLAKAERDLKAFEKRYGRTPIKLPPIQLPGGQNPLAPAFDKAAIASQKLATEQQKTALAVQRVNTEAARTASVIQRNEQAAARFATQMGRASQATQGTARGAAVLPRTIAGLSHSAAGFASAMAGAFSVGAVGAFLTSAGQAALTLEKTQATLRAVAGSQATYNEAVRIAEANQRLFGGSLADNLGPLQQFLFIANRTGASLEDLNQVAQLLATVNPMEGISGAGFALSEALSGDLTSIVDRFNLPRVALRELLAEADSADAVLAGVTQLLAEQGVSAETLAASLNTNAAAYTQLGAEASTAFTNIGGAAAAATAPLAGFVAELLRMANAAVERGGALGGFDQAFEAIRLAAQNTGIPEIVAQIDGLKVALSGIAGSSEAGSAAVLQLAEQYRTQRISADELSAATTILRDNQALLAQASGETVGRVTEATAALARGDLDAQSYTTALEGLLVSQRAVAAASEDQAAGTYTANDAIREAIAASRESATASYADAVARLQEAAAADQAERSHALLEQAILDAAAAGGPAIDAANAIAAQFRGVEAPAVVELIELYRQLHAARGAGEGALGGLGGMVKGAGQATAAIRALNRVYGAGPLGTSGAGAPAKGRKGAGGGKSDAEKAAEAELRAAEDRAEKLAQIEERAREAEKAANKTFYEDLLDIQKRYNEAVLAAQEDLKVEARASKADFYEALLFSDLPADAQQNLSAAYEAAFAEAQRLSQEGKAALADDYLALKEEQLKAEAEYQEKLAALREKAEKGGKEGREAEEQIQRLEAIKRLRDDAFAAEENKLLAEGDANVEARDEGIEQAQLKHQEALADAQSATAKAALEAEAATKEAVRLTNDEYLERLRLLQQLGPQAGGVPTLPPAATTPTAAPTAPQALAAGAVPAGGGAVPVADAGVMATLHAMQADLGGRLRAVEQAVGRVAQRSTVGGLG